MPKTTTTEKPLNKTETLRLDLACIITRIEQVNALVGRGDRDMAAALWDRVMTCDVPRLKAYPGVAELLADFSPEIL